MVAAVVIVLGHIHIQHISVQVSQRKKVEERRRLERGIKESFLRPDKAQEKVEKC